jgi:Glycosyl transferase family 2
MAADRERVIRAAYTRSGATLLASAAAAAWALTGRTGARWAGLGAVVAVCAVLLVKFAHHHATERRTHEQLSRQRSESQALRRSLAELTVRVDELTDLISDLPARLAELEELPARLDRVAADQTASARRVDDLESGTRRRIEHVGELTREGLHLIRQELDDVARRMPASARGPVDATVVDPLISIAVPAFNRPDELEACLDSVVQGIENTGTERVEVWVTDDRSTVDRAVEIAHSFAQRHSFIGFRANAENLGLERNLIQSCTPCRGRYIWILGNDDLVHPEGLGAILADAAVGDHDVLLYEKVRIDNRGRREIDRIPGHMPDDVVAGERRSYASLMDFAEATGVLSGFGFISTLLVRRTRYLAAAAEPYLGLTMYPQVGMLLETCGRGRLLLNSTPAVYHRTPTRAEKLAGSAGRREAGFMVGGDERDGRWFGDTLAALLQRVVDRSSLTVEDFAEIPEPLFGGRSLVEFIERNQEIGRRCGLQHPGDVVADARRFSSALRASRLRSGPRPQSSEVRRSRPG